MASTRIYIPAVILLLTLVLTLAWMAFLIWLLFQLCGVIG
jgi:hypothetical protein